MTEFDSFVNAASSDPDCVLWRLEGGQNQTGLYQTKTRYFDGFDIKHTDPVFYLFIKGKLALKTKNYSVAFKSWKRRFSTDGCTAWRKWVYYAESE
jgi:hypothetical protein